MRTVPAALALLAAMAAGASELPGRFAGGRTVIGLEYATLDNEAAVRNKARVYAEMGLPGMKHYVEAVDWGSMQKGPRAPIDFSRFDWFVREYQRNGFTELTVSLKSHSTWASKDIKGFLGKQVGGTNPTPKPQYLPLYEKWVGAVVERYDADGLDDMPGLRWPVRYVEIGNELSSYEPEPVGEYLAMLRVAYRAAHRAFPGVKIAHAAFLTTPVNLDVHGPGAYERAWAGTRRNDTHHGLADLRRVLDHPGTFDVLNVHNLGDPYELEHILRWLEWETGRRGYAKPVIVSDTLPTSYIAWGPATTCRGKALGILIPPATEADRCRLAAYFDKLVNKHRPTLAWTRGFVAADHVQRAVIASERGVALINLSFTSDLTWLTLPLMKAGSGISAWGGAVDVDHRTGRVSQRYPLFRALEQLMGHLAGHTSIERRRKPDPRLRVYRVEKPGGGFWIAWRDPQGVLLPADGQPSSRLELDTRAAGVTVEPVITRLGRSAADRRTIQAAGGTVVIELTHTPVFVFPR